MLTVITVDCLLRIRSICYNGLSKQVMESGLNLMTIAK